jgi:hypothetical protein
MQDNNTKKTKSVSLIPFDEIVPGSTVRVTTINGMQYLSIRDIIMCVCEKDNNQAGEIWRKLPETRKEELQGRVLNHQFPGKGQSEQPVITFQGALKLIMFLPGNAAKEHRSAMVDILRRYYAGDGSLVEELAENARSDAPIAQLARASLAAEPAAVLDDVRKRKREELEMLKLEAEIQSLQHQSQVVFWEGQRAMVDKYHALCVDTVMDERAKVMFKDVILNSTLMGRAITNGGPVVSDAAVPISISQVAASLGQQLDQKDQLQVGRLAAKLYAEKHGEAPSKHTQIVNGRATLVNNYFEPDRGILEAACKAYADLEAQARRAAAETKARSLDQWLRGGQAVN